MSDAINTFDYDSKRAFSASIGFIQDPIKEF